MTGGPAAEQPIAQRAGRGLQAARSLVWLAAQHGMRRSSAWQISPTRAASAALSGRRPWSTLAAATAGQRGMAEEEQGQAVRSARDGDSEALGRATGNLRNVGAEARDEVSGRVSAAGPGSCTGRRSAPVAGGCE